MTCVLEFAKPKMLESSPRHLSSPKCIWLRPLPHVWSMALVCPFFPCALKASCSSPQMEPSSLSLVYTHVNKALCSPSLREHVFPKQSEERHFLFFLPNPSLLPLSYMFSENLACSLFRNRGAIQSWPLSPKNVNWVDCADSYLSQ